MRGLGGFVRSSWDEVNEIIAAANVYTAKQYGPDRVIGFSPIPAMSMVSYAAGSRYLSLIGGVCMSFYDWYCDLPPSSPQVWGEQTDVPESADWYNSTYIIAWGSNVPQTRTPDAHFFTEVRYKGAKTVAVTPDYSEVAKLADIWMHPKQGTDAAVAMAMGHVVLKEFFFGAADGAVPGGRSAYFDDYARRYTDLPMLVMLKEHTLPDGSKTLVPDRYVRASDFNGKLGQANNPEWKTLAFDEAGKVVLPNGSIGFRWGPEGRADDGKWNLEDKEARHDGAVKLKLSVLEGGAQAHDVVDVAFPYFAGADTPHFKTNVQQGELNRAKVPAVRIRLGKEGDERHALVATVFDLQAAQYGIDRGLGSGAKNYDDNAAYTPAWQEAITGVPRQQLITVARQFAENAHKTHGKSMVIIGAAMNHWYHSDMNYRGVINLLMMCGCVGQERRWLGALRGPGEAAPADRLDGAGLRAGLDPPAAADEQHQLLLRPHRPVALREARHGRGAVAAGRQEAVWRQHDRLQRARRAHGLAALRPAAADQPAAGGARRGRRPASTPRTTWSRR